MNAEEIEMLLKEPHEEKKDFWVEDAVTKDTVLDAKKLSSLFDKEKFDECILVRYCLKQIMLTTIIVT